MKAIMMNQTGGPETLLLTETETPKPTENQLLIRLAAAGINHVDLWVRGGGPAYPVKLPHIPGADGAGTVEAVGPEAEGVEVGERVLILPGISCGECRWCRTGHENVCVKYEILGTARWGTYAEFVLVPDQNVLAIPDELSFEKAAAFPLAYLTAWHMLVGRARVEQKETVLITGAGGGVGVAGIQIAKSRGARVLAVTSSEEKAKELKKIGANDVFVGGEKAAFSEWVQKNTDKNGADVVMDYVGPATWEESIKSLSRCGRVVTCGATTGPVVQLELRSLFSKDGTIFGARMGTQKEFQDLAREVFAGKIDPVVSKTFPLEQAAEAHRFIEEKKQIGKVVLLNS